MADSSFIQVPKDLKDEIAVRRFLDSLVTKINILEAKVEALTQSGS